MSVPRGRYMNDAEIGQALAGQLEDIGVNVKVETREFSVHNKEFYTQEGGPLFLIGYKAPRYWDNAQYFRVITPKFATC